MCLNSQYHADAMAAQGTNPLPENNRAYIH